MMAMADPELSHSPQTSRGQMDTMITHPQPAFGGASMDPTWGYDLNLLSHAATHVAQAGQTHPENVVLQPDPTQDPTFQLMQAAAEQAAPQYDPKLLGDTYSQPPPVLEAPGPEDLIQDFNAFLENAGFSSDWPQNVLNSVEMNDNMVSPMMRFNEQLQVPRSNMNGEIGQPDEPASFSHFGSRLPSLHLESSQDQDPRFVEDQQNSKGYDSFEFPDSDYQIFVSKLEAFNDVLPRDFLPPSKQALSKYLAGYINGFHEHLPFIHIPTLSVQSHAPELILGLAAVGGQYRLENRRAVEIFYAAKAVAIEQLRRREGCGVPQGPWPHSTQQLHSPIDRAQGLSQNGRLSQYVTPGPPPLTDTGARLASIQTLLLLMAFATWERHHELLREALDFQGVLARLVREDGLTALDSTNPENLIWEDWVYFECARRTKLVVYCFFNLHSIAWNTPPLILNAELKLNLPAPADQWKASNATEWRQLCLQNLAPPITFPDAFSKLFMKPSSASAASISPLGNYILIHGLLQQIFFARQLALPSLEVSGSSIRNKNSVNLEQALAAWQSGWKRTPESSLDPRNPNGPIAFTSLALLGLAYIRLEVDMGPVRRLESRDSLQIAIALRDSPPLQRSPQLIQALLHSAHALYIHVQLGIGFVSRSQTFFWSIQNSLCNLECALLLSKWLAVVPCTNQALPISSSEPPVTEHEKKLLSWVRGMLDDTNMAQLPGAGGDQLGGPSLSLKPNHNNHPTHPQHQRPDHRDSSQSEFLEDPIKIKQLSVAVVRVWAKTFKGNTTWAIVDLIGGALEIYADMLERDGV